MYHEISRSWLSTLFSHAFIPQYTLFNRTQTIMQSLTIRMVMVMCLINLSTEVFGCLMPMEYDDNHKTNTLNVEFQTKNLVVKNLTEDMIGPAVDLNSRENAEYTTFGPALSTEEIWEKYRKAAKKFKPNENEKPSPFSVYTIWKKDGTFIGITNFHRDHVKVMRIGCILEEKSQGKGFGPEVVIAMVIYALQNLPEPHRQNKVAIGTRTDHPVVPKLMERYNKERLIEIGDPWNDPEYTKYFWQTYTIPDSSLSKLLQYLKEDGLI